MKRSGPSASAGSARSRCRTASGRPACRRGARAGRRSPAAGRCCGRERRRRALMPASSVAPDAPARRRSSRARSARLPEPTASCAGSRSTGPGASARPPARGGCATYWTESPAPRAHSPSCNGSSALAAWSGGRCGVTWRICIAVGGRPWLGAVELVANSANVTGVAPRARASRTRRSVRADRRTRRARPRVRLYGLPPTIASLEWKSRFSTGSPAAREIPRERRSCRRATSTTAAATASARRRASAARASSCSCAARARRDTAAASATRGSARPRPALRARRWCPAWSALSYGRK